MNIFPIRFDNQLSQSVYVIEIPESDNAPHMTGNKYYRRSNSIASPMEEGEIRAIYYKTKTSKMNIIKPVFQYDNRMSGNSTINPMLINDLGGTLFFHVENIGRVICDRYKAVIEIPIKLIPNKMGREQNYFVDYLKQTDETHNVFEFHKNEPVYPDEKFSRIDSTFILLNSRNFKHFKDSYIYLTLYYDGGMIKMKWKCQDIIRIHNQVITEEMFFKKIEWRTQ